MRLSLATRIFIGYAVVLVTFGAVSAFAVSELHRNQVELRLVSEGYLRLSQTAAAIETFQKNQAKDTERLREEPNVTTRRWLIQLARRYFYDLMEQKLDAGLATTHEMLEQAPDSEKPFIQDVGKRFEELKAGYQEYSTVADAAYTLLEQPSPDPSESEVRLDKLSRKETALASNIGRLYGSLQARILERVRQADERERRTGVAIIGLSVLAILVGLLATGIAARALRPVRTLIDGVSRIRRGDYTAQLGVTGQDEIAVLAREFDAMAKSLKEREAQLEEKQQALLRAERLAAVGKVSAQVAHEVRNPLSSIGLNVEMLEEQLGEATFTSPEAAKEAKDLLASVTRELDRLTGITEEYLKLARLPSPTLRRENLNAIVEDVLTFSESELREAHVNVERALPNHAVEVMADEGQLRQVFLNLVRNSREAMSKGGQLTVTVGENDQSVDVRVTDTGPGLAQEARARLFEPFFTTKQGGTGLGLSLARQMIQAHGGKLEVDPATAHGTTFVITLPRP